MNFDREISRVDCTVKHLISAVSKFRGLLKMVYWRRSIFAVINTRSVENKQNVNHAGDSNKCHSVNL